MSQAQVRKVGIFLASETLDQSPRVAYTEFSLCTMDISQKFS